MDEATKIMYLGLSAIVFACAIWLLISDYHRYIDNEYGVYTSRREAVVNYER